MSTLDEAVEALRSGGIVACPTETFVGLLADALDADAVDRVAALKGRPEGSAIALLLPSIDHVERVGLPLAPFARALAERYWPGPLTLVVRAHPSLPARILHEGTVGVRVPGPSAALELVRAYGRPLTATSANPSGAPPVQSADELPDAMRRGLAAEVPGRSPGGLPSTIVDVSLYPPRMVREGAIGRSELGLPQGRGA